MPSPCIQQVCPQMDQVSSQNLINTSIMHSRQIEYFHYPCMFLQKHRGYFLLQRLIFVFSSAFYASNVNAPESFIMRLHYPNAFDLQKLSKSCISLLCYVKQPLNYTVLRENTRKPLCLAKGATVQRQAGQK